MELKTIAELVGWCDEMKAAAAACAGEDPSPEVLGPAIEKAVQGWGALFDFGLEAATAANPTHTQPKNMLAAAVVDLVMSGGPQRAARAGDLVRDLLKS